MTNFSAMEAVELMTLGDTSMPREKQTKKELLGKLKRGGTMSVNTGGGMSDMILLTEATILISESLMTIKGRLILLTIKASGSSLVTRLQFIRRPLLQFLLISPLILLLSRSLISKQLSTDPNIKLDRVRQLFKVGSRNGA